MKVLPQATNKQLDKQIQVVFYIWACRPVYVYNVYIYICMYIGHIGHVYATKGIKNWAY